MTPSRSFSLSELRFVGFAACLLCFASLPALSSTRRRRSFLESTPPAPVRRCFGLCGWSRMHPMLPRHRSKLGWSEGESVADQELPSCRGPHGPLPKPLGCRGRFFPVNSEGPNSSSAGGARILSPPVVRRKLLNPKRWRSEPVFQPAIGPQQNQYRPRTVLVSTNFGPKGPRV